MRVWRSELVFGSCIVVLSRVAAGAESQFFPNGYVRREAAEPPMVGLKEYVHGLEAKLRSAQIGHMDAADWSSAQHSSVGGDPHRGSGLVRRVSQAEALSTVRLAIDSDGVVTPRHQGSTGAPVDIGSRKEPLHSTVHLAVDSGGAARNLAELKRSATLASGSDHTPHNFVVPHPAPSPTPRLTLGPPMMRSSHAISTIAQGNMSMADEVFVRQSPSRPAMQQMTFQQNTDEHMMRRAVGHIHEHMAGLGKNAVQELLQPDYSAQAKPVDIAPVEYHVVVHIPAVQLWVLLVGGSIVILWLFHQMCCDKENRLPPLLPEGVQAVSYDSVAKGKETPTLTAESGGTFNTNFLWTVLRMNREKKEATAVTNPAQDESSDDGSELPRPQLEEEPELEEEPGPLPLPAECRFSADVRNPK